MKIDKKRFYSYLFLMIIFLGIFSYCSYLLFVFGLDRAIIAIIVVYSLNLIFTIYIFGQYRQTKAKLSWLMVFAMFPVFGHIIFIIFGQRYNNQKFYQDYLKHGYFKKEVFTKKDSDLNKYSKLAHRGIYQGQFSFIENGDDAFNTMFASMEKATKFIHIHYYIIKKGEIYDKFKSIIIAKAKAGVKIRFIIDDFGRWALPWYEIKELRKSGIETKIFSKVQFPFLRSNNGFRTHRKQIIIDGKVAFVGGLNIADEYANLNPKYGKWFDVQAKIEGQAVRSASLLFLEDWRQLTDIRLQEKKYLLETKKGKDHGVMIEGTPETHISVLENTFLNLIRSAKHSIKLSTPYFSPTNKITDALISASLSGVDVELYIPEKFDKKIAKWSLRKNILNLQKYNIKVRSIHNAFLHSKIGVFDEKIAYFGTANLDIRSLYSQFEVIHLVKGNSVIKINQIFSQYKHLSKEVLPREYKLPFYKNNLIKFIVELFSSMV